MTPLPLTVIGGYLGAGKTTLINRILAANHGLRILVLVNDFGAINIDADLLISADEDTIELANGCVCCTMGADLFLAVGDALDRRPRPDLLIVEASGIADPARIANVARAEPDLSYAGIVTVVDGTQFSTLCADEQIAPQIKAQIACADIVAISKSDLTLSLHEMLSDLNRNAQMTSTEDLNVAQLLIPERALRDTHTAPHPVYTKWSHTGTDTFTTGSLRTALMARPPSLYRVKGRVRGTEGQGCLVQVAGPDIAMEEIAQPERSELIGIGLASLLSKEECETWWHAHFGR